MKEIISTIREFNRFYVAEFGLLNQNYLGTGYSATEMRVLYEISVTDGINAKQLSDMLRLDKSYISRIIRSFESKNLIIRKSDENDRRAFMLSLSDKGRYELDKLISVASTDIQNIVEILSHEQLEKMQFDMREIMRMFRE